MKYALAIDIGASSGRHIVGHVQNGEIICKEVYRFQNGISKENGRAVWDIEKLLTEVKKGIAAAKKYADISSLAVDTWGVDYVLMRDDTEVFPVYAYRDDGTKEAVESVHSLIPFSTLYSRTGCQFQPFNSIYKLFADKNAGRLEKVTDFFMIPEYINYKLCGAKAKEFTNATTTGLINAETLAFDSEITKKLSLPAHLFAPLYTPGTVIGQYEGIDVMLCASHDTASAVEGIPMDDGEIYISSGTWSLLGVKTEKPVTSPESFKANFSNEGGVGYNRLLKNIMGLWSVNELKKELCPEKSFDEIVSEAEQSGFERTVDINSPELLSPVSMKSAFEKLLGESLSAADCFCCAYKSLAKGYKTAVDELELVTGKTYKKIYIVGGGAKNKFLNSLTEHFTGKEVIALPLEATSLGNLKIQLEEEL